MASKQLSLNDLFRKRKSTKSVVENNALAVIEIHSNCSDSEEELSDESSQSPDQPLPDPPLEPPSPNSAEPNSLPYNNMNISTVSALLNKYVV